MAVRSVEQIMTELDGYFAPTRAVINQQKDLLPSLYDSQVGGLNQAKDNAFSDINRQANAKGMVYSGAPISEQQRYTGEKFLPALAQLKNQQNTASLDLAGQLANLHKDQGLLAQQMRQGELDREEARRQAEESARRAAAAASGGGSGGLSSILGSLLSGGSVGGASAAQIAQRKGGGFDFKDAAGKPISAAVYAKMVGIPFRDLLQKMAAGGDNGAKAALGFVGNDFGYDPGKIGNNASLYDALVWGTGKKFSGSSGGALNYKPSGGGLNILTAPQGGMRYI